MKVFILLAILFATTEATIPSLSNTCDRVIRHGYSCTSYVVQTEDDYKLTIFRMQRSSLPNNQMETNKNVVLFMHGLVCSSDTWVLNGPNDGLAYLMADAGYDVWLGNARGTEYGQDHVYHTPLLPPFWDFSWHEIGIYDTPATIDFIITTTGQTSMHYVGHSQGSTTFMVMLSTKPSYNAKIKTSHLLAPPIFMENMSSESATILGPLLDKPNILTSVLGTTQLNPADELVFMVAPAICKQQPGLYICNKMLLLVAGGSTPHTNFTLFDEFFATHPNGASIRQVVHYLQERGSKKFRRYDFGHLSNMLKYGSSSPPDYQLSNVNTAQPIQLYFSDNDIDVAVEDVYHLRSIMGSKVLLNHVKYPEYNHVDFVIANNIKEVISDCVLDRINQYENMPFSGNVCTGFL